jgi:hypothetical protein
MSSSQVARNLFETAKNQKKKSPYLLEFKAGKLLRSTGNLLTADKRKGLVFVKVSADDSLLHVCWKERNSEQVEDDFIVFPEEAEFVKIPQCTTGKAYVLKFKTSAQRLFFWLQESEEFKDDDLVKKFNDLINSGGGASGAQAEGGMDSSEQEQLMRLLQEQGFLGAEGNSSNAAASASASTATSQQTRLSQVLTPDLLKPVLSDARLRSELFPLLPEGHDHTEQELQDLIRSPQFQQAVQSLDAALMSGELAPLLQELGLDPNIALLSSDRVKALLKAIKDKKQNSMDTS